MSWNCQTFTNQFNKYTPLMPYWLVLQQNFPQYYSASACPTCWRHLWPQRSINVRRALCKDSHSHFTIHLQICQTIMLQVTIAKHFWKQITCYIDITAVIVYMSHCIYFFTFYLTLFTCWLLQLYLCLHGESRKFYFILHLCHADQKGFYSRKKLRGNTI